MNPNEIIKALENCLNGYYGCNTGSCYFFANAISEHCWICAIRQALDLIKQKDTEIAILIRKKEALRDEIEELQSVIEEIYNRMRELEFLAELMEDDGNV